MSNQRQGVSVCVIGAGPGGLAMARLLQLQGASVTVLEQRDRAGGMCHSVEHDGQWFDIGANYVTKDYREVRALAKDFDLALTSDKAFQHQLSMNVETGELVDAQKVINSGHSMLSFGLAGLRYFWFQFKYRKVVRAPGYADVGNQPELMVPFDEWLVTHKMAPLQKLFMIPITAMGFGTLDEIPTPHALRYVNASRFWSMLKTGLKIPQRWPKRFVHGFGHLWQEVANQLAVEYETDTISVDRSGASIEVVTRDRDGTEQVRQFDRLVLGTPPNVALEFLDASPEEKALYADDVIEFNHYVVATATVENFHPWVVNTMQPAAGDSGEWPTPDGHPYIFGKQWHDSDLTLYYAPIVGEQSDDQIRSRMEHDSKLSAREHRDTRWGEWKNFADWPRYFPRVSIDDMSGFQGGDGWYDQVEALQGQNRTYLCHGILSFELVELVMRYARHLVDERFE